MQNRAEGQSEPAWPVEQMLIIYLTQQRHSDVHTHTHVQTHTHVHTLSLFSLTQTLTVTHTHTCVTSCLPYTRGVNGTRACEEILLLRGTRQKGFLLNLYLTRVNLVDIRISFSRETGPRGQQRTDKTCFTQTKHTLKRPLWDLE